MRDDLERPEHVARLSGVSVRASETVILDGISLSIAPGAPTAIIGPNGSGKTTLLRVLMGLVEPDTGAVSVDGIERAIVFQKPIMLRRSVGENVAFALTAARRAADDATVRALLDHVGLSALSDRAARKLSGGEQQRLAIARALARRPHLLLLDEATASLDPAQTKIVEDLIARIAVSGVKIVFATHDLGQARRMAGDVVLLVKGCIAEQALASAFFTQPSSESGRRFIAGELVL